MINDEIKKLIDAVGALAETSIVFYRAAISIGATPEEATNLTRAFMAAMFK